mgnify:CR=1 FL=1
MLKSNISEYIKITVAITLVIVSSNSFGRLINGAVLYEWCIFALIGGVIALPEIAGILRKEWSTKLILLLPILVALFSICSSYYQFLSFVASLKIWCVLCASLIFWNVKLIDSPARILALLSALLTITSLSLLDSNSIANKQSFSNMDQYLFRGWSIHENIMALELGLFILLSMICFLTAKASRERNLSLLYTVLAALFYFSTSGLTSQVALLAAFLYIALYNRKGLQLILSNLVICTVLITPFIVGYGIPNQIFGLDITFTGRSKLWGDVINTALHSQWGIGWWNYTTRFNDWRAHTHNDLLELWVASGYIGLVAILIGGAALINLLSRLRGDLVRSTYGGLIIYILICGITEVPLTSAGFGLFCLYLTTLQADRIKA